MENAERESETKYAVYAKQKEQEKVRALGGDLFGGAETTV